jgi:hypothetical protein
LPWQLRLQQLQPEKLRVRLKVALELLLIVSLKRLFIILKCFHVLYWLLGLLIILQVRLLILFFKHLLIFVTVVSGPLLHYFLLASSDYLPAAFVVEQFNSYW